MEMTCLSKLNYATLYPSNFQKQKLSLDINVFNKKTVTVLVLIDKEDTAVFIIVVIQLWNCLNIKTKDGCVLLNDKNREPFSSIDDTRFEKVLKLAEQFKHMNISESTYSGLVMCLTSDTSNALNVTLTRLVSMIKLLLKSFPVHSQSDRLDENMEFIDSH